MTTNNRACAFALSLLLGSSVTGCASKSASTESDAGEDATPPDLGDANTHGYTPPFDGGSGPCARKISLEACSSVQGTNCTEAWNTDAITAIKQGCDDGTLESTCPAVGIAGYCVAPPGLEQLGSVVFYYTNDTTLSTDQQQCGGIGGAWCTP